tara:strand:+ start:834 stop:1064 length:231 start_codon:yes stop_codon:yes gene_type:complete
MEYLFLDLTRAYFSSSYFLDACWLPSKSFFYAVLVVGAFLTAGVAISIFSFYEDHYWIHEKFREELRANIPFAEKS